MRIQQMCLMITYFIIYYWTEFIKEIHALRAHTQPF
jgi:hypothetical protein